MKQVLTLSLAVLALAFTHSASGGIVDDGVFTIFRYTANQLSTESRGPQLVDIINDVEIVGSEPSEMAEINSYRTDQGRMRTLLSLSVVVYIGSSPKGTPIYQNLHFNLELGPLEESELNGFTVLDREDVRFHTEMYIKALAIQPDNSGNLVLHAHGVALHKNSSVKRNFSVSLPLRKTRTLLR
ncbi:MAG: hypothetical protein ACK5P5_09450 [Pseudobdellovibrionaceae bacterium]